MSAEYNFRFRIDWNVPRFNLDLTAGYIGQVKVLGYPVVGSPTQAQIDAAVAQYVEDHPGTLAGLTDDVKQALLQLAQKVAYIDDQGAQYYQDLYDALYPPMELASITAVYTQSGNVYVGESLDNLKADLVVTAIYTDASTEVIPAADYTLSGSLVEGTSTITVTYEGKTATFDVTVSTGMILLYTIPGSDLQLKSLGFTSPYCSNSTNRLSYVPFDLLIEYGKTYRIITQTDVPTADMSLHIYNTTGYNNALNGTGVNTANVSYAWKGTVDYTFTAGKINNKEAKCIRLSYRYSTSDPTITENFIDNVKIYEVTE